MKAHNNLLKLMARKLILVEKGARGVKYAYYFLGGICHTRPYGEQQAAHKGLVRD